MVPLPSLLQGPIRVSLYLLAAVIDLGKAQSLAPQSLP